MYYFNKKIVMAWLKLDKVNIINLNNVLSIRINRRGESNCISVTCTGIGLEYVSKYMTEEDCQKKFDFIQSKLLSDEIIDIS